MDVYKDGRERVAVLHIGGCVLANDWQNLTYRQRVEVAAFPFLAAPNPRGPAASARCAEVSNKPPRQGAADAKTLDQILIVLGDPPLLPARMQCNPVNLRPQITIATADAKWFFENYISLSQIRSAASMHGTQIKAALAAEGILPIADPKQVRATYYLRSEVATSRFGMAVGVALGQTASVDMHGGGTILTTVPVAVV